MKKRRKPKRYARSVRPHSPRGKPPAPTRRRQTCGGSTNCMAGTKHNVVGDTARSNRMAEVRHRFIETNSIRMHIAEQGTGPLVVLLHGFPESWYSWRHQLGALAAAGYHAVAPDLRGYGQTDRPARSELYTQLHL